jgi:hypothetical protein
MINGYYNLRISFSKFKGSPTILVYVTASVGAKIGCYVQQQLFKMSDSFGVETMNLLALSTTCFTDIAFGVRFLWFRW